MSAKAEQLRVGILSGRLGLCNLTLNPEPLDALLLESEIPLVVKAGLLSSAAIQISLLQGDLELSIEGLTLLFAPVCRWLTRAEVLSHRASEIQRLEFVHTRSQTQRRSLEREMFRQLFADYLSRLRILVKNVHFRLEIERECGDSGANAVFGAILNSCRVVPMSSGSAGAVLSVIPSADAKQSESYSSGKPNERGNAAELLLAERADIEGFMLYHEAPDVACLHIDSETYHVARSLRCSVFEQVDQAHFARALSQRCLHHQAAHPGQQLLPPTCFALGVDLRSQPLRESFQVDSCLTMEVALQLNGVSRLNATWHALRHAQWLATRMWELQLWHFLHPWSSPGGGPAARWSLLRRCVTIRRRLHSNRYILREAVAMRAHCKEYIRLYKKKFNGPSSAIAWRKTLLQITEAEARRLEDIELLYPADKLVNFRVMAHAELKTEAALNGSPHSGAGGNSTSPCASPGSEWSGCGDPYKRSARELTPLERLHLHGQQGYGAGIYRGLPPASSSLKIRIDALAPQGFWWVASLEGLRSSSSSPQKADIKAWPQVADISPDSWAIALDCTVQPVRVLLVDSLVDASVFVTVDIPAPPESQRPLSVLLGRSEAAFASGSPGRNEHRCGHATSIPKHSGGHGKREWCSILEFDCRLQCCSQAKTVLTASANSPWDIFLDVSCGPIGDSPQAVGSTCNAAHSGHVIGKQASRTWSSKREDVSEQRIRVYTWLMMPSMLPSLVADFLRWCMALHYGSNGQCREVPSGPTNSSVGWFARHISSMGNIAVFRARLRLPAVVLKSCEAAEGEEFPGLDAACHLEHGGLVDGFVVGLHHLRHFVATFLCSATGTSSSNLGGVVAHRSTNPTPLPLQPLEEAPSACFIFEVIFISLAVAHASRRRHDTRDPKADNEMRKSLEDMKLTDIMVAVSCAPDTSLAMVTLALVAFGVLAGRRALWDFRDSKVGNSSESLATSATAEVACAVARVHGFFGTALRVLLMMGFPLHSRCMTLAAWAGALEILEAATTPLGIGTQLPHAIRGLMAWAARGSYVNLPSRQGEVVRWLLGQKANVDEFDDSGRSLLDWSCWSGDVQLVSLALRAGMLPAPLRRMPGSNLPASFQLLPSPLALAVASRSPRVVNMLLRAAGDPHAPPGGGGCSPLLLAVRGCEYELGCDILRHSPFVSVAAALGPALPGGSRGILAGEAEAAASSGTSAARATAALLDSLRRFAGVLSRRGHREEVPGSQQAWSLSSAGRTSAMFGTPACPSAVLGPHPDEGLYATGQLPFTDVVHPLATQMPLPIHRVQHEQRPQHPPLRWLREASSAEAWAPVRLFIRCCLERGFRADEGVLLRALPSLPPEVCVLVHALSCGSLGSVPGTPGALEPICKPHSCEAAGRKAGSGLPTLFGTSRGLGDDENSDSLYAENTAQGMALEDPSAMFAAVSLVKGMQQVSAFTVPVETSHGCHEQLSVLTGARESARDVVAYLQSGAWDPTRLRPMMLHGGYTCKENGTMVPAKAGTHSPPPGAAHLPWPVPRRPGPPLAVRVVVLGAPQVGKTCVARCVAAEIAALREPYMLELDDGASVDAHLGWLQVAAGSWPKGDVDPRAAMYIWDTQAAPLPGLLGRMVFDPVAPTLAIVVVDAALEPLGSTIASTLTASVCGYQSCVSSLAARRTLIVENTFGVDFKAAGAKSTKGYHHVCCQVQSDDGSQALRRAFACVVSELVGELEAQQACFEANTAPRSSIPCAWPLATASVPTELRRLLAHRLRGDSGLLMDPSAISWAWAAVRAAQGGLLAEGDPNTGRKLGGALVPWERLAGVLAGAVPDGAGGVALGLFRGLVDLGLVCPIPATASEKSCSVGFSCVLVPDFARRVRLASAAAARLAGSAGNGPTEAASQHKPKEQGRSCPPVAARLRWDDPQSSGPPSLRATLRDFLSRGCLGSFGNAGAAWRIQVHRFALLEAGPAGCPVGAAAADDLAPGFFLAFDLVPADGPSTGRAIAGVASPSPRRRQSASPAPARSPGTSGANIGTLGEEEDIANLAGGGATPRLTALIVGTGWAALCKDAAPVPFWDVYCSGPHARWAWRAVLGHGTTAGLCFSSLLWNNHVRPGSSTPATSSTGAAAWPLLPPACILSTLAASALAHSPDGGEVASSFDFADMCWLLNGPRAEATRASLIPASVIVGRSLASCCAVMCGRDVRAPRLRVQDDEITDGLADCANFEVCLLSRSWRAAPKFLSNVLNAGVEAWALCSAALARIARDFEANVAGTCAVSLPLLSTSAISGGPANPRIRGQVDVMLVPEGPHPVALSCACTNGGECLASVRVSPGVSAWLSLCKPAALWSTAISARSSATMNQGSAKVVHQVVAALQVAVAVQLTERMVAEVWEAVNGLAMSGKLHRRACGTWTMLAGDWVGFVL